MASRQTTSPTRFRIALVPAVRAVVIGIATTLLALLIYWALWRFWVTHPSDNAATDLALQLLFGIAVAVFVGIGILAAIIARHADAPPTAQPGLTAPLRIIATPIEGGERANSLLGQRPQRIALMLVNDGDRLESWFRISLDLPVLGPVWNEFGPSDDPIDRSLFLAWAIPKRLNDTGEHWQLDFVKARTTWTITATYQSLGDAAVFPRSRTRFCMLALPTESFVRGETFACRYRIESANAAPAEASFVIGM